MAGDRRRIRVWTVAFWGRPAWWERWWCRDGFRHVTALAWVSEGVWIELDPALPVLGFRVLTAEGYVRRRRALMRLGARVVAGVEVRGGERSVPRIATCAGAVAHVLGRGGALRPQVLWRRLAREMEASAR